MSSYEMVVAFSGVSDRHIFSSGVAAMSEDLWPEFPCEDPTATELDDWLRVWGSSLKGLDVEALLRGATPPSLIAYSRPTDLTDFVELTPAAEPDPAKRLRHNAAVKKGHRDEAIRVETYDAGVLRIRNGFAGQLEKALRRTAPARLRRLNKASCAVAGVADAYDGVAMMAELRALVGAQGPTQRQSSAWHERQWERMRDTSLPDGCIADDFAAKCHELLEVHRPNFTRVRLDGAVLTDALIGFLPECNRIEGRGIRRDLIAATRHADYEEAVRRCLELVSDTTDVSRVEARMAASVLPAGPARVAALAAARGALRVAPLSAAVSAANLANASKQRADAASRKGNAMSGPAAAAAVPSSKAAPARARLPEGEYCKYKSCRFPHKDGEPCWCLSLCYPRPRGSRGHVQSSCARRARRRSSYAAVVLRSVLYW